MHIFGSSRSRALGVAMAVIVALVPSMVAAQATTSSWRAGLSGAGENPPTTSAATGTFTGTLDEAAGTLTWTLTVPALTNATAAHLHQGAPGTNGPVVLNLFIPATGTTANTISVSGTSKVADLTGPLAGNFAGFVTALKAGNIYANAHTTANPGGEIRGPVSIVAAAPVATPAPVVAPAPAVVPAPGKTGNAGLASTAPTSALLVVGLVLAVGALTYVGRRTTR